MSRNWSDFIQDCEAAEIGSWMVEVIAECIGMPMPELANAREVEDYFNACYILPVLQFHDKGIRLIDFRAVEVPLDGLLDLDDGPSRLLLQQRFWECVEKCGF